MSVSHVPCPSPEVLEGIAVGQAAPPPLCEHVAACEACRQALERIREDNRFLTGFAVAGTLPSSVPAERGHTLEIPGYHIVREIHRGGQGVVYQAVQRSTKRNVAIKVMKQGPFATIADRARFEREIETLSRLNHPNIVAVHDAGIVAGFHFFVMNYVEGRSLDDLAIQGERISDAALRDVLQLFGKIADVVHAAHLRGIIHRDLKPSNIRVDPSGEPHVLDFGLAKSTEAPGDSAMTETGQFVGSLPWASPEQIEGTTSTIDLRTDVYSLGAMLYQCLTGVLPFDVGSNLRQSIDRILFRDPPRPSAVAASAGRAAIDDELDTIVLKCLAKDRERRYQSAGDLARDLRSYLAGDPIEAKRDSAVYMLRKALRRYRRRVAVAGAFVVLLIVFSVVMSVLYRRSSRLEQEAVRDAASMAELLSRNNIEQGRMAGLLGNMEQAEQLLWREWLTHRGGGEDADLQLNNPPGNLEAYWALWEMYRRYPCLRTVTPQPASLHTATLSDDGTSVWTVNMAGNVENYDESGVRLDGYRLNLPNDIGLPSVDASGHYVFKFDTRRYSVWRRGAGDRPLLELPRLSPVDAGIVFASRSGRRFSAVDDGVAIVWRTDPPAELARFEAEGVGLNAATISHDDRILAARDQLGGLHVWDIESKQLLARSLARKPSREYIHNGGALAFSPDHRLVGDGWEESPGRVWEWSRHPPSFIELAEWPGSHRLQSFSPDGTLLAVGDIEGRIRIFDTSTGACRVSFVAHAGRVRSVTFSGDGRGVWTSGNDDLRFWEVASDAGVRVVRVDGDAFHGVDVTPNGDEILAGGGLGKLHRLEFPSLRMSSIDVGNDSILSDVRVSNDGRRVAVATYGNTAYLWGSPDLRLPPVKLPHPHRVSHASFSPDGSRIATACDDGGVRIWRSDDGSLEREFRTVNDRVPELAFDPTGSHLAAALRNGSLLVWDLDQGECETWKPWNLAPLRTVRYTLDGRWLLAAGGDRAVEIWDTSHHRRVDSLVGHSQEIYCLAISQQGDVIASGDSGGGIRLWHLGLRRLLATLDGHAGAVMSLCFTPDGRSLISASLDGTLRIWDLTYYARHIAGNLDSQWRRQGLHHPSDRAKADAWRHWAESNLGAANAAPTPDAQ